MERSVARMKESESWVGGEYGKGRTELVGRSVARRLTVGCTSAVKVTGAFSGWNGMMLLLRKFSTVYGIRRGEIPRRG